LVLIFVLRECNVLAWGALKSCNFVFGKMDEAEREAAGPQDAGTASFEAEKRHQPAP